MGMFDKDRVFAPDGQLTKWADDDQEFILIDGEIKDEAFVFDSNQPDRTATMTHLRVAPEGAPENVATVSTLSGPIAEKIRTQEDGDLPAIVRTMHVETDKGNAAHVIQLVRELETKEKKDILAAANSSG